MGTKERGIILSGIDQRSGMNGVSVIGRAGAGWGWGKERKNVLFSFFSPKQARSGRAAVSDSTIKRLNKIFGILCARFFNDPPEGEHEDTELQKRTSLGGTSCSSDPQSKR